MIFYSHHTQQYCCIRRLKANNITDFMFFHSDLNVAVCKVVYQSLLVINSSFIYLPPGISILKTGPTSVHISRSNLPLSFIPNKWRGAAFFVLAGVSALQSFFKAKLAVSSYNPVVSYTCRTVTSGRSTCHCCDSSYGFRGAAP